MTETEALGRILRLAQLAHGVRTDGVALVLKQFHAGSEARPEVWLLTEGGNRPWRAADGPPAKMLGDLRRELAAKIKELRRDSERAGSTADQLEQEGAEL